MAVPRFHLDRALTLGESIELPAAVAHHARNVLRLRSGDDVILFNGGGGEFRARLSQGSTSGSPLRAEVLAFDQVEREARVRITLIQSLTSADKSDWIVEKAVELGVARIILTPAARSTVRLDQARRTRRLQHWRDLAVAACCQCGRNRLVPIEAADSLQQALAAAGPDTRLILDPDAAREIAIGEAVAGPLTLAVGPEGGFAPDELAQAQQAGFIRARVGARVLRTETAGLAAATAWLALAGEFSSRRV